MKEEQNVSQKFELAAVLLTALGKFVFYDWLDQRLVYIIIMFVFWGGYLIVLTQKKPHSLQRWGFRTDNFKSVLQSILPFALVLIILCIVIGLHRNTINLHWHLLPLLVLYPVFGVLQQFLLMALVAGNLHDLFPNKKLTIITATSILFSLVHYPQGWLMLGTFILALYYTHIYLTHRNILVLGIFHGWLGAIFYYTIVGTDPFLEVFKVLF